MTIFYFFKIVSESEVVRMLTEGLKRLVFKRFRRLSGNFLVLSCPTFLSERYCLCWLFYADPHIFNQADPGFLLLWFRFGDKSNVNNRYQVSGL